MSQFTWNRNPIPELLPSAPGKEISITDVDKWMDGLRSAAKTVGGGYLMDMFDEYVRIGIEVPQLVNPLQLDHNCQADYK